MRCRSEALKQQLNGEKWDVEVGHVNNSYMVKNEM